MIFCVDLTQLRYEFMSDISLFERILIVQKSKYYLVLIILWRVYFIMQSIVQKIFIENIFLESI